MSKATNAAKQKKKERPRRKVHQHPGKGRRNPSFGFTPVGFTLSKPASLFGDPIFLNHVAGAIFRALELFPPPNGTHIWNDPPKLEPTDEDLQ